MTTSPLGPNPSGQPGVDVGFREPVDVARVTVVHQLRRPQPLRPGRPHELLLQDPPSVQ